MNIQNHQYMLIINRKFISQNKYISTKNFIISKSILVIPEMKDFDFISTVIQTKNDGYFKGYFK